MRMAAVRVSDIVCVICGLLSLLLPSVQSNCFIVEVCVRSDKLDLTWPSDICAQTVVFSFDTLQDKYAIIDSISPSPLFGVGGNTPAAYTTDSNSVIFFTELEHWGGVLTIGITNADQVVTKTENDTRQISGYSYELTAEVVESDAPIFTVSDSNNCVQSTAHIFAFLGESITNTRLLYLAGSYVICSLVIWICVFLLFFLHAPARVTTSKAFGVRWFPA